MTAFTIKKEHDRLTDASKSILSESLTDIPNGNYKVIISEIKGKYTASRYKYYFGHVVEVILLTCSDRFRIVINGSERSVRNGAEIHECLKYIYNPVTIVTPNGAFQSGSSTTALNDRDFIGTYLESILADFSSPPYNCDFSIYEDWADLIKGRL